MNNLAKILIAAIVIVLLVVVVGSWNSSKVDDNSNSIAYADFGDGIWSDGHELVGEFDDGTNGLQQNSEEFATTVADDFVQALNVYQEGEQDLEHTGTYKQPDEEGDGYMSTFEFTGPDSRMEALVYVKGTEARLKSLSNI